MDLEQKDNLFVLKKILYSLKGFFENRKTLFINLYHNTFR